MEKEFEKWILKNYVGQYMEDFPENWNRDAEFFYKINELQHRIQMKDVPEKFRN